MKDGYAPIAARSLNAIAIERYAISFGKKFLGKCELILEISTE